MRLSSRELMVMQQRMVGELVIVRVKTEPARAGAMMTLSALPNL